MSEIFEKPDLKHNSNTASLTEFLMFTGEMLLENGAETYQVETSIVNMFYALDDSSKINVIALGTQLTLGIYDGKHYTAVKRIRRRGVNLNKLARINDVVRNVSEGKLGLDEAAAKLRALDSAAIGGKTIRIFTTALFLSAMFVLMIGGSVPEAIVAFFSCLVVQTVWVFVKRSASLVFVAYIASGFLTAVIASMGASFIFYSSIERILFGAMLPLFPGVAMMIAIRDTVNGDLTSGVVRGVEATLAAVGLALGTTLGLILIAFLGEAPMAMLADTITTTELPYAVFALLVSFGAGLMLFAKLKIAVTGALIGGIVYAVFILFAATTTGVFMAALTLAALSETAARVLKVPSTLFLIIGVYPLVPGAGIYKTATLILQDNVPQALVTGNKTVAELLFMVAGIAIISALFKLMPSSKL
ncbi:MAG: threonine/serine exporter family protein [Treponema sp.]|nr:threonine/serine exporter family protein [Treponema sp.]